MQEVWSNLVAPQNIVFAGALILLLILFLIQLVGLLSGFEIFSFLDAAIDIPDFDVDVDLSVDPTGISHQFFSMLNLGKIPVIISFILLLFLFSCIGYNLQFALVYMGLFRLPWFLATPIAFVASIPLLSFGNNLLAKVMPKDETAAVSTEAFIGLVATIVIGTVTHEKQSEAKLIGPKGRTHYIQVISADPKESFTMGDKVLVASRKENLFTVIKPQNEILTQ